MNRFNQYMMSHFRDCRLLASAYDHCRHRAVRLYHIPGEFAFVGVTDGTDAWVAPVVADPFSVHVGRLLAAIQAGAPMPRVRVRVAMPHLGQPRTKHQETTPSTTKERTRVRTPTAV